MSKKYLTTYIKNGMMILSFKEDKMKKSIKTTLKVLGVGALMVPAALMMTACGDTSVNVNTKGTYEKSTYAEVTAAIDGMEAFEYSGIKFSARMSADLATLMEMISSQTPGMGAIAGLNGTVKMSADGAQKLLQIQQLTSVSLATQT